MTCSLKTSAVRIQCTWNRKDKRFMTKPNLFQQTLYIENYSAKSTVAILSEHTRPK